MQRLTLAAKYWLLKPVCDSLTTSTRLTKAASYSRLHFFIVLLLKD